MCIESITKNLYNCCKIPATMLDTNYNVLSEFGHNNLEMKFDLNSKIKSYNLINVDYKLISLKDDINFLIIPINKNIDLLGYLILGSFNLTMHYDKNICYLPYGSIKYIFFLCKNILNDSLNNSLAPSYSPYVKRAIDCINNHYEKDISLSELCSKFNINKSYFCHLFKKETGYTFVNYLNKFRIEQSKKFLQDPTFSLFDIALMVGFNNQNYYSTTFKKFTNQSPLTFRNSV